MTAPPAADDEPRIQRVDWAEFADALTAVRSEVFVVEQGVPEALEVDGLDPRCIHAAALAGGRVVGTGRLLPEPRIGRMAVLKAWRGRGIGAGLLGVLVDAARHRGDATVRLAAQVDAIDFYRRHGFVAAGQAFIEAGIAHRHMARLLAPAADEGGSGV